MPQAPLQQSIPSPFYRHKPLLQLLLLLVWLVTGMVVGTLLSFVVWLAGALIFGLITLPQLTYLLQQGSQPLLGFMYEHQASFLKTSQLVSSIFTFIFPAWMLSRSGGLKFTRYYLFRPVPLALLALVVALSFTIQHSMLATQIINQKLALPHFLSGLESWMYFKERELAKVTELMLGGTGIPQLLLNLLTVALIPAIGEELIFRGALQPIMLSMLKNKHAAIILTAFIFAAIHMQFYTLLPRFLLGVIFGYVYYYTQNLTLSMVMHFVNNGAAVIVYYYTANILHKPTVAVESESFKWLYFIASLIISGAIIYFILKKYRVYNVQQLDSGSYN